MATYAYTASRSSDNSSEYNYFTFDLSDIYNAMRDASNGISRFDTITKATLKVTSKHDGKGILGIVPKGTTVSYFSNSTSNLTNSGANVTNSDSTQTADILSYVTKNGEEAGKISNGNATSIMVKTRLITGVPVIWNVTFSIEFEFDKHVHNYNTFVESTPSTCCTYGSATYKCSCDWLQTTTYTELDPNKHEGGTDVRNTTNATCTTTGYTGDTYCLGCGNKISSGSSIAALGHNYESTIIVPTYEKDGYTQHTCKVCGDSYQSNPTINKILLGTSQPKNIWLGESQVKGLWIGTTKVFGAKE